MDLLSTSTWSSLTRRFGVRLVAAMLVVSLPLLIVMAVLLTTKASASLSAAAESKGEAVARAVTVRVQDWLSERRGDVSILAAQSTGQLTGPATAARLARADKTYGSYAVIQLIDLNGKVLSSSQPKVTLSPAAGQDWFRTASGGQLVVTSPTRQADRIEWIVAQPVLGSDGQPRAVLVADLKLTALEELMNPELDASMTVVAVDTQRRLVYDTALGKLPDDTALLAAGVLSTSVNNAATRQAEASGQPGAARLKDKSGDEVISGFRRPGRPEVVVIAKAPGRRRARPQSQNNATAPS